MKETIKLIASEIYCLICDAIGYCEHMFIQITSLI